MLTLALTTPSAVGQSSGQGLVTAHMEQVTPMLSAYGRVGLTSPLPVNVAETGIVSGLQAEPGMHVRAGQVLAKLTGPEIQSALRQDQADVRSAKTQLENARKTLAIQKEQLRAHLSTRALVHQAESALAKAESAEKNAETRLATVRHMRTVTAPASGMVTALNSHEGELLQAGQPVLTLQSHGSLWLMATYYGEDLRGIHAGMTGEFTPADGSRAIAVKVVALLGAMTPGGGESVALRPTRGKAPWLKGESGTVTLRGRSRKLPVVPTRALVLSRGKWWVMVHTAKGSHAVQVIPGPARGWNTFIERGLKPGAQVVTVNAYLLLHSQIAEHYQIPD